MRSTSIRYLCLGLLAFLGGCANLQSIAPPMAVASLEGRTQAERDDFRDRVLAALAMPSTSGDDVDAALLAFERSNSAGATRADRLTNLRETLIARADGNCEHYMNEIGANRRTYRTVLTASGTIVGAAGALSTPQRSSAILSGVAGMLSGVRGNLDEEIFQSQSLPILLNSMDARRAQLRTEIREALTFSNTSLAPSASVVVDRIRVYNEQCSLSRAISYATAQTQQAATTERKQEEQQQRTAEQAR